MNVELLRRAAEQIRVDADSATAGYVTPKRLQLLTASRAVADWLDRVATSLENGDPDLSLGEPSDARAVARAYLGEEEAS